MKNKLLILVIISLGLIISYGPYNAHNAIGQPVGINVNYIIAHFGHTGYYGQDNMWNTYNPGNGSSAIGNHKIEQTYCGNKFDEIFLSVFHETLKSKCVTFQYNWKGRLIRTTIQKENRNGDYYGRKIIKYYGGLRGHAESIMMRYFLKPTNNLRSTYHYSCDERTINGYTTLECGSFTIHGNPSKTSNYLITESLFSTQLQNKLMFLLRRSGFANDGNFNLSTAFVNYISSSRNSRLKTIAALSRMVTTGYVKPFNELIYLFAKHLAKINK